MMLHDVVAFGAGFGCGVMWLGFALMSGRWLRHCQPPEVSDIDWTGVESTIPRSQRAPPQRSATGSRSG
jgi:hypothetical protein